jgi:MFS family permease
VIPRRTVFCLGLAQLVSWGISYYLIGGFGEAIAAELGWTRGAVYGGFAAALLVMGLSSPLVGGLIDRHGGRPVMVAGSLLNTAGCIGLALGHTTTSYYAAWVCLGLAMRLTLYDAAFAALAHLGGPAARRPIAQITLLGGLASTVFWPLGHLLADQFGWRGALLAYAGFALLTLPLHLAIPRHRHAEQAAGATIDPRRAPLASGGRDLVVAASLYALIAALTNFLNAGMSAHMIGILSGLGLAASAAVWIATLRGVGQSSARLGEVLFGARVPPLVLNLVAATLLPLAFVAGSFSARSEFAAMAFAFLYGAGNGILTITRGTLPLVLFDARSYGAFVGRLVAPSFVLSAVAPLVYAFVIERAGPSGALWLSTSVAGLVLIAALTLAFRFGARSSAGSDDG